MWEWTHVAEELVAAGIGAGLVRVWQWARDQRTARGQGAILAGLERPNLFVFPPRESAKSAIGLPSVSVEDFLAMNNIISAFLRAKQPPPDHVRSTPRLTGKEKLDHNLILICSSKSNSVTKEALDQLRSTLSPRVADCVPSFEEIAGTEELQIRWKGGTYQSPSYRQTGSERTDFAIIVKATSPWAPQRHILIVAGIRGIGTWGAAEFLKKSWEPLYERKGSDRLCGTTKRGDFAALVRVRYKDLDIKPVQLIDFADLDGTSTDG